MTIKEVLDTLTEKDRATIKYAFEHDLAQYVLLSDGRYIGVNTAKVPFLKPETTVGVWSVGEVAGGQQPK